MKRIKTMSVLVAGLLGGAVMSVSAADKDIKMSSPDAAMMAQMQKNTTPGTNHMVLEPLTGKWTYTSMVDEAGRQGGRISGHGR